MNVVDLKEKFSLFNEFWSPKIAGKFTPSILRKYQPNLTLVKSRITPLYLSV